MDKMIIYAHSSEILIVANADNADNADLLCEYVGLLTDTSFPQNVILAVTLITVKIKFMRYTPIYTAYTVPYLPLLF